MVARLYFVAVLVVASLVANGNSALEATEPKKTTPDFLTPVQRTLRTANLDEEGEERGIPSFAQLKGAMSELKTKYNDGKLIRWLNRGKSTDYVFTKLGLNRAGDKLFESPKLKAWVKYRQLYNENRGIKDSSGIATLLKHYEDEHLSRLIEAARRNPDTVDIANQLRIGQIAEWLRTQKHPDYVYKNLNVVGTAHDDVNQALLTAYRKEYTDIYVLGNPPRSFDVTIKA